MSDQEGGRADVLIVGGGTAGCVLAARLSDDDGRRVVLVEAGPAGSDRALRGLDYLQPAERSRFWDGMAVEPVAGQPARPYASGRGIGGSAAVNGMVAIAPTAGDLERWVAAGCSDWSWSVVGPTVDRLRSGWAPTTEAGLGPLEQALEAATSSAGLGMFRPVALEREGTHRSSVAERILAPVLDRPNLRVLTDRTVERVLIDGGRAVGVTLLDGAVVEAAEVVLAAGAIRSPTLLAASGLVEVATAGRLRDHPSGTLTLQLRDGVPASALQTAGIVRWQTPSGALAEALPIARVGTGLAALAVALMDPVSVGRIELRPDGSLGCHLGLLGHERDRAAMREVIDGALALLAAPAMDAIVAEVWAGGSAAPASALRSASDDDLDAWVASSGPYRHAACSCPMGSVLDQTGRVPGIHALRVIDASALPVLPTVAPNATVTVLADHLAAGWSVR